MQFSLNLFPGKSTRKLFMIGNPHVMQLPKPFNESLHAEQLHTAIQEEFPV